jgi:hypothetical protein
LPVEPRTLPATAPCRRSKAGAAAEAAAAESG